jgi:hypothetical protein
MTIVLSVSKKLDRYSILRRIPMALQCCGSRLTGTMSPSTAANGSGYRILRADTPGRYGLGTSAGEGGNPMKKRKPLKVGEMVKVASLSWAERKVQTICHSRIHLISARAHYLFNPEFTFEVEGIDCLFSSLGEGLAWKRSESQLTMTFRDRDQLTAIAEAGKGGKA